MDSGLDKAAIGEDADATAAAAADAPLPIGGPNGDRFDLRLRYPGIGRGCAINTDRDARMLLSECTVFLNQVMRIVSGVVESIGIGHVRKIVAEELPLPPGVIGPDGRLAETPAPERDHRKQPRGRKHPLILLLQMGLQSARMSAQIVRGTNPNAVGKETLEQKQVRKEAEEAERSFQSLLRG